jgi:hypothetical protein
MPCGNLSNSQLRKKAITKIGGFAQPVGLDVFWHAIGPRHSGVSLRKMAEFASYIVRPYLARRDQFTGMAAVIARQCSKSILHFSHHPVDMGYENKGSRNFIGRATMFLQWSMEEVMPNLREKVNEGQLCGSGRHSANVFAPPLPTAMIAPSVDRASTIPARRAANSFPRRGTY